VRCRSKQITAFTLANRFPWHLSAEQRPQNVARSAEVSTQGYKVLRSADADALGRVVCTAVVGRRAGGGDPTRLRLDPGVARLVLLEPRGAALQQVSNARKLHEVWSNSCKLAKILIENSC
jgi:hypothetical protein